MSKLSRVTGITIAAIAILSLGACGRTPSPPQAIDGVLDLASWDLAGDGPVHLSGEWEFYWEQLLLPDDFAGTNPPPPTGLVELPDSWNGYVVDGVQLSGDGYATYRLRILLGDPNGPPLALKMPEFETAYTLYVNGEKVAANGVVGKTAQTMRPQWLPLVADAPADRDKLDLVLQISNFHHRKGGAGQIIQLGTEDQMRRTRERNLSLELFLFGSLFIIGFYYAILFMFRRSDSSALYFGICCFLMALRVLVTGEYYLAAHAPWMGWELVVKLAYLSFGLTPPIFALFVRTLLPEEIPPWFTRALNIIGAVFASIVVLTPAKIFTHALIPYQIVLIAGAAYAIGAVVLAAVRGREYAIILLTGLLFPILAMTNDILHNNHIIRTGYLGPFGVLAFVLTQAFLLSRRLSRTFAQVENLSKELEERIVERTEQLSITNEQLGRVNADLQEEINERRQAEETLRDYADRLRAMYEIDQFILAARSAEAIAVAAASQIRRLMRCQQVVITEVTGTGEVNKLAAESSGEIPIRGNLDVYQEIYEGQPLSTGLIQGAEDLSAQPRRTPMQRTLYQEGVRSYVVVPLHVQNELIGALHLEASQPKAFSAIHVNTATEIATLLAVGIQQIRLYEQAQRELAERIQAEAALRQQTIELEARNAELDAFAHTVAHDLKSPVTAMIGYSELLVEHASKMPKEDLNFYLQTITQGGYKIVNIIDELLLLASVRAVDEIEMYPLDMAHLVAEAQGRLTSVIEEHQAVISLPKTWPVALGYGPWVEEVWTNYLSNAIKYGGRPPHIQLGASPQQNGFVRFWVHDDGPGLTPEEQERLFTPFERLEQIEMEGQGLGLSIVLRIVAKLGGEVGVESAADRGSVFFFTLPGE